MTISFTVKTLLLNLNAQFEFRNSELLLIVRWGSMVGHIKLRTVTILLKWGIFLKFDSWILVFKLIRFWVQRRWISIWLSLFLRSFESLFRFPPMSIFIKISLFHASKSVWILKMSKWKILAGQIKSNLEILRNFKNKIWKLSKFNEKQVFLYRKFSPFGSFLSFWTLITCLQLIFKFSILLTYSRVIKYESHESLMMRLFSDLRLRKRPGYNSKRHNQSILLLYRILYD